MDYKDFIKAGNKVAFIPTYDRFFGWSWDVEPKVVTIGEYRPYYTDGSADPKPEEYDELCRVEIVEDVAGESQISLSELFAIIPMTEETYAIWGTDCCKIVGRVDAEDEDYFVLDHDGEWKIVAEDDFDIERDIFDLSRDELVRLRKQICVCSMFVSDYINSFGVNPDALCNLCEDYWSYLCDEFGEDEADAHDTPEEFANFAAA